MVPLTGLEPVRDRLPADFKSAMSTYSIIAAYSVVSLLRQEPPAEPKGCFGGMLREQGTWKPEKAADINGFPIWHFVCHGRF